MKTSDNVIEQYFLWKWSLSWEARFSFFFKCSYYLLQDPIYDGECFTLNILGLQQISKVYTPPLKAKLV